MLRLSRAIIPGLFSIGSAVLGCGILNAPGQAGGGNATGGNDEPENTAPPVDALTDPSHPGIQSCAKGDVDATLQIASDFKDSCHEMIICGGLAASFSGSLLQLLINVASGDSTQPSGFVYVGNGTYTSGTRMRVTVRLGENVTFGKKGDVIPFDVFDITTYFKKLVIKAKASVDLSGTTKTSLSMSFEGPGPGIELLGIGPDAQSPLNVDFDTIAASLGRRITLENTITVDDEKGDSHIRYHLSGTPVPIRDIFTGNDVPMDLVEVEGSRTSSSQTIKVSNWAMKYRAGSSGTLDGSIDFDVLGGAFPYAVRFTYPHRKAPDVLLSCKE